MAGKTGVLIPFPRGRGTATAFRGSDVMEDSSSKRVDRKGCIDLLNGVVPVPKELVELLELPERLYIVGDNPSFSSDPAKGIASVIASLTFGTNMPMDLPDYGIHISSRGSNVFCTFIDRGRKIIVMDSVASAYGGEGSWESLMYSIRDAIGSAQARTSKGESFDFVVNNESSMRAISL